MYCRPAATSPPWFWSFHVFSTFVISKCSGCDALEIKANQQKQDKPTEVQSAPGSPFPRCSTRCRPRQAAREGPNQEKAVLRRPLLAAAGVLAGTVTCTTHVAGGTMVTTEIWAPCPQPPSTLRKAVPAPGTWHRSPRSKGRLLPGAPPCPPAAQTHRRSTKGCPPPLLLRACCPVLRPPHSLRRTWQGVG